MNVEENFIGHINWLYENKANIWHVRMDKLDVKCEKGCDCLLVDPVYLFADEKMALLFLKEVLKSRVKELENQLKESRFS